MASQAEREALYRLFQERLGTLSDLRSVDVSNPLYNTDTQRLAAEGFGGYNPQAQNPVTPAYTSELLRSLLGDSAQIAPYATVGDDNLGSGAVTAPISSGFTVRAGGEGGVVGHYGGDGSLLRTERDEGDSGLMRAMRVLMPAGAIGVMGGAAFAPEMLGGTAAAGSAAPISASTPSWVAPGTAAPIAASTPSWTAPAAGAAAPIGSSAPSWVAPAAGSGLASGLRNLAPLAGALVSGGSGTPSLPTTGVDPQAQQDAAIDGINALFSSDKRAPIYQRVYDDVYGLQSGRLNENREDTLRNLRFGLARTGLSGGSAAIDEHGREQREFGRALSDASNAAQRSADQVRASDESTRLNLISQMRAGLSSENATQSALAQMADNVNAARSANRFDALDSYMASMTPTLQRFDTQQGQRAARNQWNATRYPQASGSNGTIVR